MNKFDMFKSLLLTISASKTINSIICLLIIFGMIFNAFNITFYKIITVILIAELLFIDYNTHYYVEGEENG